MGKTLIEVSGLKKVYRVGSERVHALAGVDFTMDQGEFCAIVGTSGSGKSTLLNMLAGLEPPTRGSVRIGKVEISKLSERQLVAFRREHIGFIFQSFNLIPTMTAEENVALPLIFKGVSKSVRMHKARKMLKDMGLSSRAKHRPNELSGGQRQRVAIARALVVDPAIIFADEPTGNLDSKTSWEILRLIRRVARERGQTVVMVTHDRELAELADRIFDISDGKILSIEPGRYADWTDEQLAALMEEETGDKGAKGDEKDSKDAENVKASDGVDSGAATGKSDDNGEAGTDKESDADHGSGDSQTAEKPSDKKTQKRNELTDDAPGEELARAPSDNKEVKARTTGS